MRDLHGVCANHTSEGQPRRGHLHSGRTPIWKSAAWNLVPSAVIRPCVSTMTCPTPFVRTALSSAAPRRRHFVAIVAFVGALKFHVSFVPTRHRTYPDVISSAENPCWDAAGNERGGARRRGGGLLVGALELP